MLHILLQQDEFDILGLMTTVNREFDRVAMHGTRLALVEMQAKAAGLPLHVIHLPWPCSNAQYESIMKDFYADTLGMGVDTVVFGDLFLRDIRDYREKQLAGTGITPVFPLWKLPTVELAEEMITKGLRARLVCVDPAKLDIDFAGREFDLQLLADLPRSVDPCGEFGEFHTFTYAGPMFSSSIPIQSGPTVHRDGFVFADILPCV